MTDNQIIQIARLYGTPIQEKNAEVEYRFTLEQLKMLISTTITVEREACAKICERTKVADIKTGNELARLIRARGQPLKKEDTTDAKWIARCLAASTIPKEFRTKEFK